MYGLMGAFAGASLLGGVGNALGLAAAPEAGLITLGVADLPITADEVAFRALATVGDQSIRVANQDVAEQAAKEFVGSNPKPLFDRNAPSTVRGWESADGTRRIYGPHVDAEGPHYNLRNLETNGNLHVRW
jgi:hypothetical protein